MKYELNRSKQILKSFLLLLLCVIGISLTYRGEVQAGIVTDAFPADYGAGYIRIGAANFCGKTGSGGALFDGIATEAGFRDWVASKVGTGVKCSHTSNWYSGETKTYVGKTTGTFHYHKAYRYSGQWYDAVVTVSTGTNSVGWQYRSSGTVSSVYSSSLDLSKKNNQTNVSIQLYYCDYQSVDANASHSTANWTPAYINFKGVIYFTDMDVDEGWGSSQFTDNLHVAVSNTSLTYSSTKVVLGTKESYDAESNPGGATAIQQKGGLCFNLSNGALSLTYYANGGHGSSIGASGNVISYYISPAKGGLPTRFPSSGGVVDKDSCVEYSYYNYLSLSQIQYGGASINNITGWTFSGWYTDYACTTPAGTSALLTTDNITVYGYYTPSQTTFTAYGAWNDENNVDGHRQNASISIQNSYNGATTSGVYYTTSGQGAGVVSMTAPLYTGDWNNSPTTFTVTPSPPNLYSNSGGGIYYGIYTSSATVTFSHTPERITINVVGSWDDDNNRDGIRTTPTFRLTGGGGGAGNAPIDVTKNFSTSTQTMAANVYQYKNGQAITYTLSESGVHADYRVDYTNGSTTSSNHTFNVVNRHAPYRKTVTANITYDDDTDRDGVRPKQVAYTITCDDPTIPAVTKNSALHDCNGSNKNVNNLNVLFTDMYVNKKNHVAVPVNYSISQATINKYETTTSQAPDVFNFVNKYDPERVSIKIAKKWIDDFDRDGIRPENLKIAISGTDGSKHNTTITPLSDYYIWRFTYKNLFKYYDHGKKISYTASEENVPGYDLTFNKTTETSAEVYDIQLENTHEIERIDVNINVEWEDDNNRDGIRPKDVDTTLYGSDDNSYDLNINDGTWKGKIQNLPKFLDKGKPIDYILMPEDVPEYSREILVNDYEITVIYTHIPYTTDVNVEKVWGDDFDRDGLRPDEIYIELSGSDGSFIEAVLNEINNWTHTFGGLFVNHDTGTRIKYTVTEKKVENYDDTVSDKTEYDKVVDNTHDIALTAVSVYTIWEDEDNRDGIRPNETRIALEGTDDSSIGKILHEHIHWAGEFSNIPVFFNHGEAIIYSLTQQPIKGYDTEIEFDTPNNTFIVTNTHIPQRRTPKIVEIWDDEDDRDGIRPGTTQPSLIANKTQSYITELYAETQWYHEFPPLYVYENGEKIEYKVTQDKIPGYETVITYDEDEDMYTIVNTHLPEKVTVNVSSTWDDDNNRDGVRPSKQNFHFFGTDGIKKSFKTKAEEWNLSIPNLYKYMEGGTPIQYYIDNFGVDAYTSSETTEDNNIVISNLHSPAKKNIQVTNNFYDDNDRDGKRPSDVKATLIGVDGPEKEITMTANSDEVITIEDLYVYDNGKEIDYEIVPEAVKHYTDKQNVDDNNVVQLNYHYDPELLNIKVKKVWEDTKKQSKERSNVELVLSGSDGSKYTGKIKKNALNKTFTFENLHRYANGKEIKYTLSEAPMKNYMSDIVKDKNGNYTVTNTYDGDTGKSTGTGKKKEDMPNFNDPNGNNPNSGLGNGDPNNNDPNNGLGNGDPNSDGSGGTGGLTDGLKSLVPKTGELISNFAFMLLIIIPLMIIVVLIITKKRRNDN